jgi:hypothetical protein
MAVQPFVGPWPLFQFFDLYTVGRTPWTGDQPVARSLPTHRTTQTQKKKHTQISMPRVGFEPTVPAFERAKTVHALSRVSIARSCSCAANLFVCLCVNNRVRVQHRSAATACGSLSTLFLFHKTVSSKRAQHTEIPLPRDKEPLRFGSTRAKVRARQHGIDFARQSNEHCLARQLRAIDIRL